MGNVRLLVLDVLKPHEPSILKLAGSISDLKGVDGCDISVYEIDSKVENVKVTIVQAEPSRRQEFVGGFGGLILSMSKQEIEEFRKEAGFGVPTFLFGEIHFNQTRDHAELEFTDFTAPLASERRSIKLRKTLGSWVVTEDKLIGIS